MDNLPGENTPLTSVVVNNSSKLRNSIIVILGLLLLGGGASVYYMYKAEQNTEITPPVVVVEENIPTQPMRMNPVLSSITKEQYLSMVKPIEPLKTEDRPCQSDFHDGREYYQCLESFYLDKYPQVKRVNAECMEITLTSGQKKKLCGNSTEGASSENYLFKGYFPNIGYLFFVAYWEGSSYLLINEKTGEGIRLWGEPIFSPSGNKFITTSVDLEAGYNPNGFQVGQKRGDTYVLIHQRNVTSGMLDPVWVDENTFYFKRPAPPPNYSPTEIDYAAYSFDGSENKHKNEKCGYSTETSLRQEETSALVSAGMTSWNTYANVECGFELKHPSDWVIDENPVGSSQEVLVILSSPIDPRCGGDCNGNSINIYLYNSECESQDWVEGSEPRIYWKRICMPENGLEVFLEVINPPEDKLLMEQIFSTLKFIE